MLSLPNCSACILEIVLKMIKLRGVLNFSAKSIRRRICHVKAYAWNVNFSAFAIKELFRIKACQWRQNALKFKFRCTKIYILTCDQYIFGRNKFKLVITGQNVNELNSKMNQIGCCYFIGDFQIRILWIKIGHPNLMVDAILVTGWSLLIRGHTPEHTVN